jgi:heterodisulfide reductase subunit B
MMRADHGTARGRGESSATEESSPEVRYGYDPGCSRPPGGGAGEDAVLEVANALGLTLEEIEEPGGCGREARAMNAIPAYARVGRLLAVAARQLAAREDASVPPSVVTPCSACFRNLSRARNSLATHADLRDRVAEELAVTGLFLDPGSVRVRHLLDVLYEDAGPDEIRRHVTNPLTHLRVAPYTGCLVARSGIPEPGLENPGPPSRLEEILSALGAEVVAFPLEAHCCGGRAAEASEEVATSLHHRILRSAADHGADVIAVVCPRCLRNLEAGQEPVNRRFRTRFAIPVRYFTDLLAEALGVAPRTSPGVRS